MVRKHCLYLYCILYPVNQSCPFTYFVRGGVGAHMRPRMCGGKRTTCCSWFSLYPVSPGDCTQWSGLAASLLACPGPINSKERFYISVPFEVSSLLFKAYIAYA